VNCDRARRLLDPYVDGELAPQERQRVEGHLRICASCAAERSRLEALIEAVKRSGRHRPPPGLERQVRAALAADAVTGWPGLPWRWLWLVASPLAGAALGIWIALTFFAGWSEQDVALRELVGAHVRSLMADNLVHVASGDPHTVKPWFAGRLDFAAEVEDLASKGFDLIGARLDYLAQRPVAALVYRRREHVINLFVLPAGPGTEQAAAELTRHGYNIVQWRRDDLAFRAISDLNMGELKVFTRFVGPRRPVVSGRAARVPNALNGVRASRERRGAAGGRSECRGCARRS
jgi:anti-sigma factor RsiW